MEGATTTNIAQAGNIREDMFRLLVMRRPRDRRRLDSQRQRVLRARRPSRPAAQRGTFLLRAERRRVSLRPADRSLPAPTTRPSPEASVRKLARRDQGHAADGPRGTDSPVYQDAAEPAGAEPDGAAGRAAGLPRGGGLRRGQTAARRSAPARARGGVVRVGERGAAHGRAARSSGSGAWPGRATRSRRCASCCPTTWRPTSAWARSTRSSATSTGRTRRSSA